MKTTISILILVCAFSSPSQAASLDVEVETETIQTGHTQATQEVLFSAKFSDRVDRLIGSTSGHSFIDRSGFQHSLVREADTVAYGDGVTIRNYAYKSTTPYQQALGETEAWSGNDTFRFKINRPNQEGLAFATMPETANFSSPVPPLMIESVGPAAIWSKWNTILGQDGGILWGHTQGSLSLAWTNLSNEFIVPPQYHVTIFDLERGEIPVSSGTWDWTTNRYNPYITLTPEDFNELPNGNYWVLVLALPNEPGVGDGLFGGADFVWLTQGSTTIFANAQVHTQRLATLSFELRIVDVVQPAPAIAIAHMPGGQFVVTYTGVLQSSPDISTPFEDVEGAESPYTVPASSPSRLFFRARSE